MDIGYIAGSLVAIGTLHQILAMPMILQEARNLAREEMDRIMAAHEAEVDARMSALHDRLGGLATKEGLDAVRNRLDSIDERLRHLERQGK